MNSILTFALSLFITVVVIFPSIEAGEKWLCIVLVIVFNFTAIILDNMSKEKKDEDR